MFKNFILYNCSIDSSVHVYELGKQLFDLLNLDINLIGYFVFDKNNELQMHETNRSDFESLILNNDSVFKLSANLKSNEVDIFTFGYMNDIFDSFSYIDITFDLRLFNDEKIILIEQLIERINFFSYGISYITNDLFESISYITGQSFINLFPYEDSYLWEQELNNEYFKGNNYLRKLRLVYESNYIDESILELQIDNTSLSDWIKCNNLGMLKKIGKKLWLWKIEIDQLEYLNSVLGSAGYLVSWQNSIKKTSKKIP